MNLFKYTLFCILIIWLIPSNQTVLASGSSATPSVIKIENIIPGQSFKTKIKITKFSTEYDSTLKINTEGNYLQKWIDIENKKEIIIKAGQSEIEIPITINIPKNTRFGTYRSKIVFNIEDKKTAAEKTFNIISGLGHIIDVEIKVNNKDIKKLEIDWHTFLDAHPPHKFATINVPGLIPLVLEVKNIGNSKISIKKISLDIFTTNNKKIELIDYNKKITLEAFSEKKIFVDIPSYLPIGKYKVKMSIFDETQYRPIYKKDAYLEVKQQEINILDRFKLLFSPYLEKIYIISIASIALLSIKIFIKIKK